MTIGITIGLPGRPSAGPVPHRSLLKRGLVGLGCAVLALVAAIGIFVGVSIYKIDHAVHHVNVPASLLAKGKDDLLAVVRGPLHSEEIYLFHPAAGHTHVLLVPSKLGISELGGQIVPISSLNIHRPEAIIAGLSRLGIPVSRYVGVDLHMVNPTSNLGLLATGKLSVASLLSDPTGTTSLLEAVASHVYLGPHTPTSALLSLMDVPTSNPIAVPTETDANGNVVLAAAFVAILRNFL
jgi:hypothetical protein